jgi:hypothetical protein
MQTLCGFQPLFGGVSRKGHECNRGRRIGHGSPGKRSFAVCNRGLPASHSNQEDPLRRGVPSLRDVEDEATGGCLGKVEIVAMARGERDFWNDVSGQVVCGSVVDGRPHPPRGAAEAGGGSSPSSINYSLAEV